MLIWQFGFKPSYGLLLLHCLRAREHQIFCLFKEKTDLAIEI
jgi:hypothetical protein